jgi:hypothetical protein
MMVKVPERMPAQPTPATARPTTRAVEVGAAPHMAEPISKMMMAIKYTHLME